MTPSMPPLPPDVTAQQMPSSLRFAQAAGGAPAPATGEQFDPIAFAVSTLGEIAAKLKDVADVLVVKKPALMPILQHMVQAGGALTNELQSSAQGPAPPQGDLPTRPQFATPDSTAGTVSMG